MKLIQAFLSLTLLTCYIHADKTEMKPLIERYDPVTAENESSVARRFLLREKPKKTLAHPSTITPEGFFEVLEEGTIRHLQIDTGEVTEYPNRVITPATLLRLGIGYRYFYALYENGNVYAVPRTQGTAEKILSDVQLLDVEAGKGGNESIYYVRRNRLTVHRGTHYPSSQVPFEIDTTIALGRRYEPLGVCCFTFPWRYVYTPIRIESIMASGDICQVETLYHHNRSYYGDTFPTSYNMTTQEETDANPTLSKAYLTERDQLSLAGAIPLTALIAYAESNPAMLEIISLAEAAQSNQSFISGAQLTAAQQEALNHPLWRHILKQYIS